jgi:hypothetical protein
MTPRIITPAERAARRQKQPLRGLGDVVAAITKSVGIKPCAGCQKRQAALNKAVPFSTNPANPPTM